MNIGASAGVVMRTAELFLIVIIIISTLFLSSSYAQSTAGKCGIEGIRNKIIGGTAVSIEKYPWYVALIPTGEFNRALQGSNSPLTVFCGGSLITTKHVLSAAHCFASIRQSGGNWKAKLVGVIGLSNRCTPTWKDYSPFSNVVIHQQYNADTVKNDISLIYLTKEITGGTPVCFPSTANYRHTGEVTVVGYGTTKENSNKTPCTLLETTVLEYTRAECMRTAVAIQIRGLPGVICAGVRNGTADSCQGDSGGPLMYLKGGQYVLEGIVSFGNGCARRNNPGVYTSVAYYSNWVKTRLNKSRGPPTNNFDFNSWIKCILNFDVRPCINAAQQPAVDDDDGKEYDVSTASEA